MTSWKIKTETRFKKQYKNIDSQIKQRVNQEITELRIPKILQGLANTSKAREYLHTTLESIE